jgi:phosphoglycolate phosphatase-like HAD superfamily hydrolase
MIGGTPSGPRPREPMTTNRLAVFDLDGTLTATNDVDSRCFVEAVRAELGFTVDDDWSRYRDCTDEGILAEACESRSGGFLDAPRRERVKRRFADLLAEAAGAAPVEFAPLPGASALLARLASTGWVVCIATGAWRVSAELKLQAAGLPRSLPLFCSDGLRGREAILRSAMAHGRAVATASIVRTVAVGDGVWDVAAAAGLSLPFVGVAEGPRAERLRRAGAAVVIPDYTDLEGAVRALEAAPPPSSAPRSPPS